MADHTITVYKTRALLLKDVKEDQFQLKVHLCRKKKEKKKKEEIPQLNILQVISNNSYIKPEVFFLSLTELFRYKTKHLMIFVIIYLCNKFPVFSPEFCCNVITRSLINLIRQIFFHSM